jgi:hypothetical protein
MTPLFLDRSRGSRPHLELRVAVFVVGALLALGGMYLETRWLVGLAIFVLAAGMLVRFIPGGESPTDEPEREADDQDAALHS